jgi:hypothetical protein
MKPFEVLEKLKISASQKAKKTLDVIYEICEEQEQRGLADFSIATISRLGQQRGVPKAQSLRNKSGESYRALICAFEGKHQNSDLPKKVKNEGDWIEEIKNPKHKLLARIQASELVAANKKLLEFVPPGTRIEIFDHQNIEGQEGSKLSNLERRALEFIISDKFLNKWSFTVSEYGEVVDGSGVVVLRSGTVDAVNKALTYL